MKISSRQARILVPSLAVSLALVAQWPARARADSVLAPGKESSAGGATDAWLVSRGLLGSAMFAEQSSGGLIAPPAGVEVDETRQSERRTGQTLIQIKSWNETVGDDTVHIEVSTLPSHQYEVGFWRFPNHRPGCTMFEWALYDNGRALQSRFWRNEQTVRLPGSAKLPNDLYPDAIPWMAFLRAFDAPRAGAEGTLNQQITPYSYVGQDVSAKRTEQIRVPAGDFPALKVTAQVDIATMMPSWPRFVLHIIQPVVPENVLYFQAMPPYRLLKQEGPTYVGGPEVTTELIRFYVAGAQPTGSAAPPFKTPGARVAAVLGDLSIPE
jgi:hypothetical protein